MLQGLRSLGRLSAGCQMLGRRACRNWIAPLSATNIHIHNAAEKVWPVCMTAENIFAPRLFHPVLISIRHKIAPQSVRMLVLSLVPETERLITLPAAPRNALTDKTATTVLVLPLHQAVHTSIQPKAALLSVSIPVIIHVSETEQHIINLAGQVIAWVMKYVNMAFAKRRL